MFLLRPRLRQIKRSIWNRGIFLFWCLLWVRRDEFHYSLDSDVEALICASQEFSEWYWDNLSLRREIAHKRDVRVMERLFFFRALSWRSA